MILFLPEFIRFSQKRYQKSFPIIIQIDAIDTIHILVIDVLAHTREVPER